MNIQKFLLHILPAASICVLPGCSSAPEKPAVDVVQVEATANEALRIAVEDSVRIIYITAALDFMSKRVDLLDSISITSPIAATAENQLQIALLKEEVAFLRKFMENQNYVPLINPSRKQAPEAVGPFPPEYDQAQQLFLRKNYEAAAKQFEKVTVIYPKSNWAADAWYWSGEAQMNLGNYSQAISAFEKVFFYSESIKQPDAQFQIGICLSRMGNIEHAKTALRKVQEFYPKSPRALQAQTELNKIK